MNYPNEDKVLVGDKLVLWGESIGIVVCSIDDANYSEKYTESDWSYLKKGIIVESDSDGVIHITESEPTFRLISRRVE